MKLASHSPQGKISFNPKLKKSSLSRRVFTYFFALWMGVTGATGLGCRTTPFRSNSRRPFVIQPSRGTSNQFSPHEPLVEGFHQKKSKAYAELRSTLSRLESFRKMKDKFLAGDVRTLIDSNENENKGNFLGTLWDISPSSLFPNEEKDTLSKLTATNYGVRKTFLLFNEDMRRMAFPTEQVFKMYEKLPAPTKKHILTSSLSLFNYNVEMTERYIVDYLLTYHFLNYKRPYILDPEDEHNLWRSLEKLTVTLLTIKEKMVKKMKEGAADSQTSFEKATTLARAWVSEAFSFFVFLKNGNLEFIDIQTLKKKDFLGMGERLRLSFIKTKEDEDDTGGAYNLSNAELKKFFPPSVISLRNEKIVRGIDANIKRAIDKHIPFLFFGDCNDFTFLFMWLARSMGIPSGPLLFKYDFFLDDSQYSIAHAVAWYSIEGRRYYFDPLNKLLSEDKIGLIKGMESLIKDSGGREVKEWIREGGNNQLMIQLFGKMVDFAIH